MASRSKLTASHRLFSPRQHPKDVADELFWFGSGCAKFRRCAALRAHKNSSGFAAIGVTTEQSTGQTEAVLLASLFAQIGRADRQLAVLGRGKRISTSLFSRAVGKIPENELSEDSTLSCVFAVTFEDDQPQCRLLIARSGKNAPTREAAGVPAWIRRKTLPPPTRSPKWCGLSSNVVLADGVCDSAAPWSAAPIASASSGITPPRGAASKQLLQRPLHPWNPTHSASQDDRIDRRGFHASFGQGTAGGWIVRSTRSSVSSSNFPREIVRFRCSGSDVPVEMINGMSIVTSSSTDRSHLAFFDPHRAAAEAPRSCRRSIL